MIRRRRRIQQVHHVFLDQNILFHAIDSYSRFSAAFVVPDTYLNVAVSAFSSIWIS